MAIRTYKDLEVFQEAYGAALEISKFAKSFPSFEQFELARQLRRAARSVPANIVEGWAKRNSAPEFKRYLQVAIGSCDEVKLWLEIVAMKDTHRMQSSANMLIGLIESGQCSRAFGNIGAPMRSSFSLRPCFLVSLPHERSDGR